MCVFRAADALIEYVFLCVIVFSSLVDRNESF